MKTDLFETLSQATKPAPYQNLSKESANHLVRNIYFKSGIEAVVVMLTSGLEHAKRINNLKLAKLIEQDIETFIALWAERELEILEEEKDMALFEAEIERLKSESYEFREDRDDYVSIREEEQSIENAQNAWEERNKL